MCVCSPQHIVYCTGLYKGKTSMKCNRTSPLKTHTSRFDILRLPAQCLMWCRKLQQNLIYKKVTLHSLHKIKYIYIYIYIRTISLLCFSKPRAMKYTNNNRKHTQKMQFTIQAIMPLLQHIFTK